MYLIIFEDGNIVRTETMDQDTLDQADDGILDVIRVDGGLPMRYWNRVWEPVPTV